MSGAQSGGLKNGPSMFWIKQLHNAAARDTRILNLKKVSIYGVVIFWVCVAPPRLAAFVAIPARVHFTGVLVPIDHTTRKGVLENLHVIIVNERRIFLLDKMATAGSVGLNRMILQRLFPQVLRFVGPDHLVRRLVSPAILGKTLTIDGLLYTESRRLFVTEIDDGEAVGPD